jgi:hypothetical protein
MISDTWLPTTRLSTADDAVGWTKRTRSPAPMENWFQLMMEPLDARTFMTPEDGWVIVTWPLTTVAPWGRPP